ncbi:hypothetical protein C2W63_00288 [Bacillus velezensis]|nr:hypothetical protein C2W63_00288 [Bacillus velezensis]
MIYKIAMVVSPSPKRDRSWARQKVINDVFLKRGTIHLTLSVFFF